MTTARPLDAPAPRRSRCLLKAAAQYVLLPVAAVLTAFLILEAGLRITGLQADFFFQPDPDISATYIPRKTGWHVFPAHRQWIEINSFGYRDREWSVAKPPNAVRVALLGDSYVAGLEVPVGQRLSERLAEQLNAHCGDTRRYEVLNFGVTGYGTAQELETLRHRVLQFRPDLVLLFFYEGNDLFDNSVELDPEPNRLHYVFGPSGELVALPFTVRDNAVKRWLRAHSKAYNFLRDRISTLQAVHRAMIGAGLMQDAASPDAENNALQALQVSQYLRDAPPEIDRAWEVTKALFPEVQRLATENDARFAVVIIPTKETILRRIPAKDSNPSRWDMERPLERMAQICGDLGIDCVQLVDAFRAPGVDVEKCFFSEGHWTGNGHAVASGAIFDALRDLICSRDGTAPG